MREDTLPFPAPPFTDGFIPAFARCCFCIAASLLVFTSPMTSAYDCYCINQAVSISFDPFKLTIMLNGGCHMAVIISKSSGSQLSA